MPYGPQTLWPDHCIQGTHGAAFHPGSRLDQGRTHHPQGFPPAIDSYSAFFENDHKTPTGLAGYLRERGIAFGHAGRPGDRLSASPIPRSTRCGAASTTTIRLDACRGIDLGGSLATMTSEMSAAGVTLL